MKLDLDTTKPTIMKFWAPWCGPCKILSPILDGLLKRHGKKFAYRSVNVDEEQALASRYGITSIPTILVFKNGEIVMRIHGLHTEKTLEEKLLATL